MPEKKTKNYEENFKVLKNISEELKNGDLGVDELVKKGKTATESATICLEILKEERGNFKTIEEELEKISKDIESLIDGE